MLRPSIKKNDHREQKFFASSKKADKKSSESVEYVSYHKIFPAQMRYSEQNVLEKVAKANAKGKATWNKAEKRWEYEHHHGTSILPKKKALPVVHAPFGYVLTDGHHDVLSSIKLGAEMIPIKVIKDLSHLSEKQFWNEAEQNGWAYLYTTSGEKVSPPKEFSELKDDTNRYFAAITARKYTSNDDGSYSSKGANYPLWIKVDKDIPFIEFKIANALFAKDFVYDSEQMKNSPSDEVIEQARKILLEANIPGLRVIGSRQYFEQIELNQEVSAPVRKLGK
jgi:hypothetical protein